VLALIGEHHVTAYHQVGNCSGDEHLAAGGHPGDPGRNVRGDSTDVIAPHFALSGVNPGSHLETQSLGAVTDGAGGSNCSAGTAEGSERSIATGLHKAPVKPLDCGSDEAIVGVEHLASLSITQPGRNLTFEAAQRCEIGVVRLEVAHAGEHSLGVLRSKDHRHLASRVKAVDDRFLDADSVHEDLYTLAQESRECA
jgi:hypothetical protein